MIVKFNLDDIREMVLEAVNRILNEDVFITNHLFF